MPRVKLKKQDSNNLGLNVTHGFMGHLFNSMLFSSGVISKNKILVLVIELVIAGILFGYFLKVYSVKTYSNIQIDKNGKAVLDKHKQGFFTLHDVSQSKYEIKPFLSDDISVIVIDLGIITEFTPQDIIPDKKNLTSIYFTDQNKIEQIQKNGLSFYARYPELQNKQAERVFLVTALMTLLLQAIFKKFKSVLLEED